MSAVTVGAGGGDGMTAWRATCGRHAVVHVGARGGLKRGMTVAAQGPRRGRLLARTLEHPGRPCLPPASGALLGAVLPRHRVRTRLAACPVAGLGVTGRIY